MRASSLLCAPESRESPERAAFRADVIKGLSASPKQLSPKYFYDEAGSRLFDLICRLPEYYPTRTELGVLKAHAGDIAALAGPGASLVEFGSGSSVKVRLLLDALERPAAYVPIDISGPHMRAAVTALARDYPSVAMTPVEGDFTRPLELPDLGEGGRRIGFFPGSTIGNFTPAEAEAFLTHARQSLGAGAALVLGFDLPKERAVLEAAYDDHQGVTAAFNLNLLTRMNRELGTDFDLSAFHHRAVFNEAESRIEMHLESRAAQTVRLDGVRFTFAPGETIHTENSYKYAAPRLMGMAQAAGWRQAALWTDPRRWFAVAVLEAV